MADVILLFDASSMSWAHWEASRAIQAADAQPNGEADYDHYWRRPSHGKGILKNNDTYWMTVRDERKYQNSGGRALGVVALKGTRPNPAIMIDKLQMEDAAEERRARMAEEKEFRRWDKEERMKEELADMKQQRAVIVARKELRWPRKVCADVTIETEQKSSEEA